MNMSNYRLITLAAAFSLLTAACCDKASISGTAEGLPEEELVVKKLSGGVVTALDTVRTDADGKYSYRLEVEDGEPQFVYIYNDSSKLASLILSKGEKVQVVSQANGSYTVEGSPESELLRQTEADFSAFMGRLEASLASEDAAAASKEYVTYYRSRIKFVMDNSKSLSAIPVLYQKVNDGFPIFSQTTDAILFRSIHDSLMTVYPKSKYVAALGEEVKRKTNLMDLEVRMRSAAVLSYPEVELPASDGKKVKLSEVGAKVVMLYFWLASDNSHKMYNNDVLIPLYDEFHDKGFEIYAVALDTDKSVWASAVKDQKLPWINVCDGLGAGSPVVSLYNVSAKLPVALMIVDGELKSIPIKGEADLRKALRDNL